MACAVLHRLLQKAAVRLRRIRHLARGMQLFVEYARHGGISDELCFAETSQTLELTHALSQLWARRPRVPAPPLMVGVTLFHLIDEHNYTPSLFAQEQCAKHEKLDAALDQLNARYGKNTIYFASSHRALDSAPLRIAFSFVPDIDLRTQIEQCLAESLP